LNPSFLGATTIGHQVAVRVVQERWWRRVRSLSNQLLRQAIAVYDRCCPQDPDRAGALQTLARVSEKRGDYAAAEPNYRRAIATLAELFKGEPHDGLGFAYDDLGTFLLVRHRYAEAEQNLSAAAAIYSRTEGADSVFLYSNKIYQAQALMALNSPAEGAAMAADAIGTLEHLAGADDDRTLAARTAAVSIALERGDLATARTLLERNQTSFSSGRPLDATSCSLRCAESTGLLARLLAVEGRYASAVTASDMAMEVKRRLGLERTESYAILEVQRADLDAANGRPRDALAGYRKVIAAFQPSATELPEPYVQATLGLVSTVLQEDSASAQSTATALLSRILALPDREYFAGWEAKAQGLLGRAMLAAGNPAEAETHLRRALNLRQMIDVADSPWLASSRIELSLCLLKEGQREEIHGLLEQAARALSRNPEVAENIHERLRIAQDRL
jgi:tetratricopeptide (TPR) repeat protein